MPKEIRKLSEAIQENKKLADVGSLTDFQNQEVIVWEVEMKTTKYGPAAYLTISTSEEGERFIVLTHSAVILGQLSRFDKENVLPLAVTLRKEGKYFILR